MISLCYKRLGSDDFVSKTCEICKYQVHPNAITCKCGYWAVSKGYVACLAFWDDNKRLFYPWKKTRTIIQNYEVSE